LLLNGQPATLYLQIMFPLKMFCLPASFLIHPIT